MTNNHSRNHSRLAQAKPPIAAEPTAPSWLSSKLRRLDVLLALLLLMGGVAVLTLKAMTSQSLRLDEAQSLWQTSHSIGDTLRVVAQDVHVPLYHVILHFWQLYFGNGVVTARLLSLVFLLGTIPLVYILARHVLTRGWSLFAAAIFTFLPFVDWYGGEARMYTLLAFFATLSQIYFIRILQGRKAWKGYGISAVIGAYTHYFFSFNLIAQGVFYLTNRKKFASGSFKRFLVVGILVALALAPWLWYYHSLGSGKNTSPNLPTPSTVDFFNAYSQFLFGFQNDRINTILVSCWPLVILFGFFAIRRGQRISPEINYIISAAFVPVIIVFVLSFIVSPFFLSRYMISAIAPMVILVVWFISNYGRRASRIAAALIVAVLVISSLQQYFSPSTPVKEDYQQVAADITRQAGPQDVVAISAPFTVYPFEYYYNSTAQIQTLPAWDRRAAGAIPTFDAATLPAQVKALAKDHQNVYLLLSQDQGYEETIRQYFLQNYPQVSKHVYSSDLTLYVFKVGYYTVPRLDSAKVQLTEQEAAGYAQAQQ
ncbi:glycosyltransferase family 39 protein [Aeromicrobium sp.]|nr:glycosyltransferase family 39 protein [Candidatus Saccharibacteria bacterium]